MNQLQKTSGATPNFKALYILNNTYKNKHNAAIAREIALKLSQKDPKTKNKNYINKAEQYNCDIYISPNNNKNIEENGVKLILIRNGYASRLGTYFEPEDFSLDYYNLFFKRIDSEKRTMRALFTQAGIVLLIILAGLAANFKKLTSSPSGKMSNPTTIIDSLKTDSIKAISADSLNLSKKLIK